MDNNRFWEIVYPYICSIVRVNDSTTATELKIRIENMHDLILNQHDPMYEERSLPDDHINWIILRIYAFHLLLLIDEIPDDIILQSANGLYYRDEIHKLPRLTEPSLKRTLKTLHRFAAAILDNPSKHRIILATATPMKNMNDEINDLIRFVSK